MSEFNKKTRESLLKALSYYSLRELPPEDTGEDVWIKALALATKYDGNDYFVGIEKDPLTLANRVKKDFGPTSAIVRIKSIYPYLYLSAEYMPRSGMNKDAKVEYLTKFGIKEDLTKKTVKELDNLIIGTAIKLQLMQNNFSDNYISDITEDEQDGIEEEIGGNEGETQDE